MRTSSSSSSPLHLSILAIFALAALAACSDEGSSADCADDDPPKTETFPNTALRRAQLRLEQRTAYSQDGSSKIDVLAVASLVDLSTISVESRFPSPCCGSRACFLLTGAPVEKCRGEEAGQCGAVTCQEKETCVNDVCVPCAQDPLEADTVTVEGLAGGPLSLEKKAKGSFLAPTSLGAPLYGSGEIKLSVTGKSEAGYFPSYDQQLVPPDPIEVTAPDPTVANSAPGSDLVVEWKAGNGDWIEVTLRSDDPQMTDKIVCIAVDDGCMTIPIGALEEMRRNMKPEEKIDMYITRFRSTVKDLDGSTSVQIKASSRLDMKLDQ